MLCGIGSYLLGNSQICSVWNWGVCKYVNAVIWGIFRITPHRLRSAFDVLCFDFWAWQWKEIKKRNSQAIEGFEFLKYCDIIRFNIPRKIFYPQQDVKKWENRFLTQSTYPLPVPTVSTASPRPTAKRCFAWKRALSQRIINAGNTNMILWKEFLDVRPSFSSLTRTISSFKM